MVRLAAVKEMFYTFMEEYVCGRPENCRTMFDGASVVEYSTIGRQQSVGDIIKALKTNEDFDVHYTTVADLMEFEDEQDYILMAKGHHFQAYRDGAYLFPFLWGGKYEFAVNKERGKIDWIKFYLEYEFGNTYLPKIQWGWKLYEETKELKTSIVGDYRKYQAIVPREEKEQIRTEIYKLLWDWDNFYVDKCLERVTEDVYARVKLFEEVGPSKEYYGKAEFAQLMKDNLAYEDQTQMSVLFEDISLEKDGNEALVHMKRYNPGKIVNKHVDVSTIHKLFCNMRFAAKLVKQGDNWLLKEVNVTPINDVDALGFNIKEVKENELNSVQSAFYR